MDIHDMIDELIDLQQHLPKKLVRLCTSAVEHIGNERAELLVAYSSLAAAFHALRRTMDVRAPGLIATGEAMATILRTNIDRKFDR